MAQCGCDKANRIHVCGLLTCTLCGHTFSHSFETVRRYFDPLSSVIRPPYSRAKRFDRILSNAYGTRVPKVPDGLIKSIFTHRCGSPRDIYELMKASTNRKFKRYDALSYLCRHICAHNINPLTLREHDWCRMCFQEVLRTHRRVRETFPAYSYLVELCLYAIGREDLVPYVNGLKCKRRRLYYNRVYGPIFCSPPITAS